MAKKNTRTLKDILNDTEISLEKRKKIENQVKKYESLLNHEVIIETPDYSIPAIEEENVLSLKGYCDTYPITFIELAMLNKFLQMSYTKPNNHIRVLSYGNIDGMGRFSYNGAFDATQGWLFVCKFPEDNNEYIFQTKIYLDSRQEIVTQLHVSVKHAMEIPDIEKTFDKLRTIAFNNSEYKGKCIKVRLKEGHFAGIEIIEFEKNKNELVLNETQKKFLEHFVNRVQRGGSARYLLNGEPGTGKTESIRDIIRKLTPDVTFIIPDFTTTEDLTIILEACEIFEKAVIIMDDIDLYLGSRSNGSYTRLLGEFLSFFDGVKKRKISLLASTNDKGLVDKAAERPGRFNMTLDYTFLTEEQIDAVCKIHLPKQYQLPEVYEALKGRVNGKKAKITGAFIANLADNIKEMAEDDVNWSLYDTIDLINESYKGFYMSQVDKKEHIGFKYED